MTVSSLAYFAILMIPLAVVLMAFLIALGKRPGFRRRHQDPNFTGVERRRSGQNICGCDGFCMGRPTECSYQRIILHRNLDLK